ncbi:protein of unknown function [Xenorhabdus poinarii G6]|uniref:Uncharacterized protein n=1 Tax=Xenorhabdus poinarii G6 TaxID=1354304 RepID=A0A068R4E5_9GAMM|nr:protein of unknown function [Xenorhabdus poinarii G6]
MFAHLTRKMRGLASNGLFYQQRNHIKNIKFMKMIIHHYDLMNEAFSTDRK